MPTVPLTWLLRIACAVMLLGHGWVCWNGDMPLRALLWDEKLATGWVKSFTGMEWGEWASSLQVDAKIDAAIRWQAVIFFGLAATVLLPLRRRWLFAACVVATLDLTFLVWLKYHDAGLGIGQFVEHLGQVFTPMVLAFWICGRTRTAWWLAAFGIAATFVGHGLFALDLGSQNLWLNHPRPGRFTEMTMLCLGLETEAFANRLLVVAGVLDLLVALLIFTRRWPRAISLAWMVIWGFATALARPWAFYEPTAASETLLRWIPEALYRTPHFALPLFLLLALRGRRADRSDPPS